MRPGTAFGTLHKTESKNVLGMFEIASVATPLELSRIVVSDTWLDVLDRKKPLGTWNLLIDTGASPERLVAIDFGLGLTEILGGVPVLGGDQVRIRCPEEWVPYLNRDAVQSAIDRIFAIDDAAIEAVIAATPESWRPDNPRFGELGSYLKSRRESLVPAFTAGGFL
jgi:hypothetical protein